ncbi:MAG: glycosyltransferase family 9 protein [Nitrospinae bacterium]|nr:glycosyltransferase family 9 protein [Nitrospinota bacterium]
MGPIVLPDNARILVIRPDRIGDVILSTPVLVSLRMEKPGWKIAMLVRPTVAPLLEGHPAIDELLTLDTDEKPSWNNTAPLAGILRLKKFDAALHLYSDFWVSLAVWRAGVPVRIGPASKLARIFYNTAIPQRRSRGERHEADYNLDLLAPLGVPPLRRSMLPVTPDAIGAAAALLDPSRKNIGVFPGMGGSARNWKPEQYARLIDILGAEGNNVILMGGAADAGIVDAVAAACATTPKRFAGAHLKELAAFIHRLDVFVAPSTGPLHIAGAVGTPAVGIYCPIRVCLPRRWGPIGTRDAALRPDVPMCDVCVKEQCPYWDCMDRLTADEAAAAVKERL